MIDNQLALRRFIDTEAVLADAGGKRGDQKCGRSSTQLGYRRAVGGPVLHEGPSGLSSCVACREQWESRS